MELIDKRGTPLTTTFDDLEIGDCFQDEEDDICIKVSSNSMIWTHGNGNWQNSLFDSEEWVLPLNASLTVERKGQR